MMGIGFRMQGPTRRRKEDWGELDYNAKWAYRLMPVTVTV